MSGLQRLFLVQKVHTCPSCMFFCSLVLWMKDNYFLWICEHGVKGTWGEREIFNSTFWKPKHSKILSFSLIEGRKTWLLTPTCDPKPHTTPGCFIAYQIFHWNDSTSTPVLIYGNVQVLVLLCKQNTSMF